MKKYKILEILEKWLEIEKKEFDEDVTEDKLDTYEDKRHYIYTQATIDTIEMIIHIIKKED